MALLCLCKLFPNKGILDMLANTICCLLDQDHANGPIADVWVTSLVAASASACDLISSFVCTSILSTLPRFFVFKEQYAPLYVVSVAVLISAESFQSSAPSMKVCAFLPTN
jgi:hypothetical protein